MRAEGLESETCGRSGAFESRGRAPLCLADKAGGQRTAAKAFVDRRLDQGHNGVSGDVGGVVPSACCQLWRLRLLLASVGGCGDWLRIVGLWNSCCASLSTHPLLALPFQFFGPPSQTGCQMSLTRPFGALTGMACAGWWPCQLGVECGMVDKWAASWMSQANT